MGSSFQKWCCGLGQGTVWPVQASKASFRGVSHLKAEVLEENTSFVKASKSPLARLTETSVFLKHLSLQMENTPKVAFPLGGLASLAKLVFSLSI